MRQRLSAARDWALAQARPGLALLRRHPVRLALAPFLLVLLWLLALVPFTPGISDLRKARVEEPTVVLAAGGEKLAEYRRVNRRWVPLDKVAQPVVDALIATEDHRFFAHHGIDFRRTAAAVLNTLRGRREGGSTITQQLARNLFPDEIGRSATLTRKAKEAITALKIEALYSKEEILEIYLNTVPFLYNAFGIEMAAQTYFDKPAERLDVLEAATLVAMLKGTSYYNPVLNPDRARTRRNLVLAQMARHGKLAPARAEALAKRPLRLDFERQVEPLGPAPHLARHLRRWLIAWADRADYDIHADGLVVRTTIDMRLQKAANRAVERQVDALQGLADRRRGRGEERHLLQAGFLALDPRNGHVKAWVGSADFAQDQFDHVSQARRQPGSTFKPFVYGAAFGRGFRPDSTLVDQPVAIGGGRDEPVWSPRDATPPSGRPMMLRDALAQSRNSITAQLVDRVGAERVADLARALGVRESPLEAVPSLALGTSPVTLREMVTAYASIAQEGQYREPVLVTHIEDRDGRTVAVFAARQPEQAMPRRDALQLIDTMRGVVDEGTARALRTRWGIQADVAGKTGTTQDNTDGWFLLAHPQLVAGAWVGFNDSRITMGEWGQGARSALPIVGEFFSQALRQRAIDTRAEFAIPRPKPRARPQPGEAPGAPAPVEEIVRDLVNRLWRMIQ